MIVKYETTSGTFTGNDTTYIGISDPMNGEKYYAVVYNGGPVVSSVWTDESHNELISADRWSRVIGPDTGSRAKCPACGQWGEREHACDYCGHPVD